MNKKKLSKIIGAIVTIVAIVFIVKRLIDMDIDYTFVFRQENIGTIVWASIIYGLHMFVLCIPWKNIIQIVSGKNVPFHEASFILNKSNLMKYIPGNVFQYVGRNEIAIRLSIGQMDVAFSTVVDVGLNIVSVFLVSLILYSEGVFKWIGEYGASGLLFILIVIAVVAIAAAILFVKKKEAVKDFFNKLRSFNRLKSILRMVWNIVFYIAMGLLTGALFFIVLQNIVGVDVELSMLPVIMGAYLLSWIAGFVVPGSSGGMDIREATLPFF